MAMLPYSSAVRHVVWAFFFFALTKTRKTRHVVQGPSPDLSQNVSGEKHTFCHARDLDRHHHHLTDSLPPRLGLSKTF